MVSQQGYLFKQYTRPPVSALGYNTTVLLVAEHSSCLQIQYRVGETITRKLH